MLGSGIIFSSRVVFGLKEAAFGHQGPACALLRMCGAPGLLTSARMASKKSKGATRNKRKTTPGKHRGLKLFDGEWVWKGAILARQRGYWWHPGLNVSVSKKDKSLNALENGWVKVSEEPWYPNPNSVYGELYEVEETYKGHLRKFVHVIPAKQSQRFKLVQQT